MENLGKFSPKAFFFFKTFPMVFVNANFTAFDQKLDRGKSPRMSHWVERFSCLTTLTNSPESCSFIASLTVLRSHKVGFHCTEISSPLQHRIVPQVPLPTINSRVVRILLQYLYTGRCLFTRDDLNLGLDLLATADRFLLEPMRLQCERALSEKIDAEVCILRSYCTW